MNFCLRLLKPPDKLKPPFFLGSLGAAVGEECKVEPEDLCEFANEAVLFEGEEGVLAGVGAGAWWTGSGGAGRLGAGGVAVR